MSPLAALKRRILALPLLGSLSLSERTASARLPAVDYATTVWKSFFASDTLVVTSAVPLPVARTSTE